MEYHYLLQRGLKEKMHISAQNTVKYDHYYYMFLRDYPVDEVFPVLISKGLVIIESIALSEFTRFSCLVFFI